MGIKTDCRKPPPTMWTWLGHSRAGRHLSCTETQPHQGTVWKPLSTASFICSPHVRWDHLALCFLQEHCLYFNEMWDSLFLSYGVGSFTVNLWPERINLRHLHPPFYMFVAFKPSYFTCVSEAAIHVSEARKNSQQLEKPSWKALRQDPKASFYRRGKWDSGGSRCSSNHRASPAQPHTHLALTPQDHFITFLAHIQRKMYILPQQDLLLPLQKCQLKTDHSAFNCLFATGLKISMLVPENKEHNKTLHEAKQATGAWPTDSRWEADKRWKAETCHTGKKDMWPGINTESHHYKYHF